MPRGPATAGQPPSPAWPADRPARSSTSSASRTTPTSSPPAWTSTSRRMAYAESIAHSVGVTERVSFLQANVVKVALGRQSARVGRAGSRVFDRPHRLPGRSSRHQAARLDHSTACGPVAQPSSATSTSATPTGPSRTSPARLETDPPLTTRLVKSLRAIGVRRRTIGGPARSDRDQPVCLGEPADVTAHG